MLVSLSLLSMILATLANEIRNLSNILFLALQKFALEEDKLELNCHDQNLMTKRDLDSITKIFVQNLR